MDTFKYYEVAEKIQRYIKEMYLRAGEKLPGIRVFAQKYGVSKNTVIKAFDYLADRQFIELREKYGAYVTWEAWFGERKDDFWYRFSPQEPTTTAHQDFIKHVNSVAPDRICVSTAKFSPEFNADTYLAYAVKDLYRKVLSENLSNRMLDAASAKEAVCAHLKTKGIVAEPENILLTQGVRHSYSIALQTLLSKNMYLLSETPSLINGPYFAGVAGATHVPVDMDEEGIDVSRFRDMRYRRNAVLVASAIHQYPTGADMSRARMLELLDICKELHIPIIELDFFSDCVNGTPLRAIDDNTVIYCGTLRHTFALNMNVGWLVVPKCMYMKFRGYQMVNNLYPDGLTHALLDALLRNGYYYSFLRHSASLAKDRVELTNKLLRQYLSPQVEWNEANAKILYWLRFQNINVKALFEGLPDIIHVQGQIFDPRYSEYLSFCPLSLTEEELGHFMRTVAAKLKEPSFQLN